jgi:hypothetical protein
MELEKMDRWIRAEWLAETIEDKLKEMIISSLKTRCYQRVAIFGNDLDKFHSQLRDLRDDYREYPSRVSAEKLENLCRNTIFRTGIDRTVESDKDWEKYLCNRRNFN